MGKKASSRNNFIKQLPDKELLLEYFAKLQSNKNFYVVAYEGKEPGSIMHEVSEHHYLYRVFLNKIDSSMYASYLAQKNKINPEFLDCIGANYKELQLFIEEVKNKNPNKPIKMSAYVLIYNMLTEIDILWTNKKEYML